MLLTTPVDTGTAANGAEVAQAEEAISRMAGMGTENRRCRKARPKVSNERLCTHPYHMVSYTVYISLLFFRQQQWQPAAEESTIGAF